LSLIADTAVLPTPKAQLNLSSHHLLWELIRDELLDNPTVLDGDVEHYLDQRRRRLHISSEGFDGALFLRRLVLPAYRQGIARWLRRLGLPLAVYGLGWDQCPEFSGIWGGAIKTREQFNAAVAASAVLVYAWPESYCHEMDSLGKPVLRVGAQHRGLRAGTLAELLSAQAARTPESKTPASGCALGASQGEVLSVGAILRLVQTADVVG
jgi:hypothetical protein